MGSFPQRRTAGVTTEGTAALLCLESNPWGSKVAGSKPLTSGYLEPATACYQS